MERYRRASVRRHKNEEKPSFKAKLFRQSVVCLVIFAAVLILSLFKTETATGISNRLQSSISYTVDYKATIKDIIEKIKKGTDADDIQKTDTTD